MQGFVGGWKGQEGGIHARQGRFSHIDHPRSHLPHVEPGSIFRYRRGTGEGFNREWLQGRLNADIAAHLRQPTAHRVTNLVMADGGEAAFGTAFVTPCKKAGREPGIFHHMPRDVGCVVLLIELRDVFRCAAM